MGMLGGDAIPGLTLAAQALEVQRSTLDMLARNVAAAQVAGHSGFIRFLPRITTDASGAPKICGVQTQHVASGSIVTEMLAMMQAQRIYEGDATLFSLSKHLAEATIAMGRT